MRDLIYNVSSLSIYSISYVDASKFVCAIRNREIAIGTNAITIYRIMYCVTYQKRQSYMRCMIV